MNANRWMKITMVAVLLGISGLAHPERPPHARRSDSPRPRAVSAGHDPIHVEPFERAVHRSARATTVAATATTALRRHANWVLAKATSATVRRISSPFTVEGRRTGAGPLVIGIGMSVSGGPYPFHWVMVYRISGGSPALAFTAGPAHERIAFTFFEQRGTFWLEPVSVQDDATLVAVMVFVVNGVIDNVEWTPRAQGVAVTSLVRSGTGAASLYVSAPSFGVGVAAASAGAGAGRYSRTVPAGIAGAIEWLSCQACAGSWSGPDGQTHDWVNLRHQAWPVCWCGATVGFGGEFAGPAGEWNWVWAGVAASDHGAVLDDGTGVLLAEPVLAAYAPIGSDWVLFTPCQTTKDCLLGS